MSDERKVPEHIEELIETLTYAAQDYQEAICKLDKARAALKTGIANALARAHAAPKAAQGEETA